MISHLASVDGQNENNRPRSCPRRFCVSCICCYFDMSCSVLTAASHLQFVGRDLWQRHGRRRHPRRYPTVIGDGGDRAQVNEGGEAIVQASCFRRKSLKFMTAHDKKTESISRLPVAAPPGPGPPYHPSLNIWPSVPPTEGNVLLVCGAL